MKRATVRFRASTAPPRAFLDPGDHPGDGWLPYGFDLGSLGSFIFYTITNKSITEETVLARISAIVFCAAAVLSPARAEAQTRDQIYDAAIAAHPFHPFDYSRLRVCPGSAVPPRDQAPDSVFRYAYQRSVFEAAGVREAYEDAVRRAVAAGDREIKYEAPAPAIQQRIKAMWEEGVKNGKIRCDGRDPLKSAVFMFESRLPTEAIDLWNIDPNIILEEEPSLLDMALSRAESEQSFAYLAEIIQKRGGLSRQDLESRGIVETPESLQRRAYQDALSKANGGDASSMHEVGVLFGRGRGVSRDVAAANEWLTKAADRAVATQQYHLLGVIGSAYTDEIARRADSPGTLWLPSDYGKAVKYFALAGAGGDIASIYQAARLYDAGGPNLRSDPAEAERLYRLVISSGDPEWLSAAKFRLGRMIANGKIPGGIQTANAMLSTDPAAPINNILYRSDIITWQCSHRLEDREQCEQWAVPWGDMAPLQ